MKAIVIFSSKYGTTEKYARWISEAIDAPCYEASDIKPAALSDYDLVIYGGGLYAGGISGVKLVTNNPCKRLIVFTVGLATPELTDYSEILKRNFTPEQLSNTQLFHFQGGINYGRLGPVHKAMMAVMKKRISKIPPAERTNDDHELLKTYGGNVDFTNKMAITPLLDYIQTL